MLKTLRLTVVSGLLLATLTGCGMIDYFYLPPPEDTAQELYEAGRDAMQEKDYYSAIRYFGDLTARYPFSPYTPQAEIGLGDAYFLNEDYLAAVDAYKEFEALHPRHEEIPYVYFQIGVASYKSFTSIDRPQPAIRDGLEYLYQLQELYPGTVYAEKGREYIVLCRSILAKHEIYVADFYWRRDRYVSAWKRYQYVVDNFPDLPEESAYAARRAELAYVRAQDDLSRGEWEKTHKTWKSIFSWL